MRKFAIITIASAAMDNSQGEGSYYGGGYGRNSGLQNSQGAASYYYGGGNRSAPSYGVPANPAGGCRFHPSQYGC